LKSFVTILLVAAVLIALGLGLTQRKHSRPHSESPEAMELCREGTADLYAFRLKSAAEKLGRCLVLDPSFAEASISRAAALARLGQRTQMQQELSRADSLTALIGDERRRMLAQLRLSAFSKSEFRTMNDSILTRLSREMPDDINVLVARAEHARRNEDNASYEQALLDILKVNPNYAQSYNLLGYMELSRGHYEQAIEHMQKYAFLAPGLANPHDSLGEVYLAIGRYEDAEREFTSAIKIQRDFYHSLINLGKTYVARGQIKKGLEILEMVREPVQGSGLERRVDREIVSTFLVSELDQELKRMTAIFIVRYPDDDISAMLRAIRLTKLGRVAEGRAVMDSTVAAWQQTEDYRKYKHSRLMVENNNQQLAGYAADALGDHQTGAEHWRLALESFGTNLNDRWYVQYRLAKDLLALNQPRLALAEIDPLLETNPRRIGVLVLKVQCHLALRQKKAASAALEQLQWSLSKADADYPLRHQANAMAAQVQRLEAP